MLKEFKEWYEEELNDQKKYAEMAEKAPYEYQGILKDISKEEASHAVLLEAIIKDYTSHCPEEEIEEETSEKEEVSEEPKEETMTATEAVRNLFGINK